MQDIVLLLLFARVRADGTDCKTKIGYVDYSWLFTYAVFMIGR
jgi:hypothetical protein